MSWQRVVLPVLAIGVTLAMTAWYFARPATPEHLQALEPGVVLLRYEATSESTEQRELGFLNTMRTEFPHLNILFSNQFLGTSRETSLQRSRELLENYGDSIQGICCVCEINGDGMLQALKEHELTGKVPFVNIDPSASMIDALKEGKMAGIVLQNPVKIGRAAVETMLQHLSGETVPRRVSTGESLVTADNLADEDLQELLFPARFEGEAFEPAEVQYTIAVIPKGQTHEFWSSVRAGAEQAAKTHGGTKIDFRAPQLEGDLDGQIQIVRDVIAEGVDGICLSPISAKLLVPVVIEAKAQGIPTVIFDSDLYDGELYQDGDAKISYVATNNYEAGAIAARQLAAAVK